ncbi:hypothetical protein OD91_2683 [Lutibacter sp. Hel_I_33_5]|uniref:hypothetical protein n=1 Tax=Lutibacter sp. Hel_I_33_5 TaxID=1566289 RepID=UPI00119E04D8|nr:hypothetical protein [Lutibacter sp. Hel_I_33_5]TVZ57362.1 hypothetical protein OD91_2683 [Lutibacter sp. Hel_I_33_5]
MPLKTRIPLYSVLMIMLVFSVCLNTQNVNSQNKPARKSTGVSVSPAHFHFNQKQGEVKTYNITINNSTNSNMQFNVNMYDFDMNSRGKSSFLPPGKGKYSLSKWLSVSPTFVELKPFEKRLVKVTVSVPNDDSGRKAAWSILMVEQEAPRTSLANTRKSNGTVALGVIPTFAFGIFAYQNPPNVLSNKVEFTDFQFDQSEDTASLFLKVQNTGDGIAYCTSYIDLTNLSTGQQERLKVKKFTIIPELERNFSFTLPDKLPSGKYLAVGVLDYESSDEIQAAKMEFEIK